MLQKDELGRRGEELAALHLSALGYRVLDRNWRCPAGELDLVALDGRELVVVEVKTRSSLAFGDPLEAVTAPKLRRIGRLAAAWRAAHVAVRSARTRIDLVGVVLPASGPPTIDHLRDVS